MAGPSTLSSSGSPQSSGRGEKRKAEDGGGGSSGGAGQSHTRSKRNRYISIACNECKRRKIKCNGQTPCQRCGNLSLECIYAPNCCTSSVKDSEEFQHMRDQISSLQEQVDDLYANLSELRALRQPDGFHVPSAPSDAIYAGENGRPMSTSTGRTLPPLPGPSSRRASQKSYPPFHGPTSSLYGFDVAKSSLQTMGITQASNEDGAGSRERSTNASPMPTTPHPTKDPLWLIDQAEALRLCRLYDEEIGFMYPQIDMDKVYKHVRMLYNFLGPALRTGFAQPGLPGADAIDDEDTTVLKLVLAISLMLEGNGKSELGERFFQSATTAVNLKIVIDGSLDLKSVHLMILTATYHFHKDEEAKAWRFIGIAARLCIEMGLHRKESLLRTFTNEAEYLVAIRTFWVVYALDRRWSFGTGMAFALQDGDIDPYLPEPDDSVPYLKHITKYNQIAARVWFNNVASESGAGVKSDEIGFLDFQVMQWYQQLPESMKFNSKDLRGEMKVPGRGMQRLRLIMLLRRNQARINIYRPIMLSATGILENRQNAQNVVEVAKETIQTLTGINKISDMYRTQQVCYNYFLVQALAVIFLAVSHAPAEFCGAGQTREEFYGALDLIKTFNTKSHIAKRLWGTIRGLKEMGDKIGLLARGSNPGLNDQDEDAHSSAAVAMAGLAGHSIESLNGFTDDSAQQALAYSPEDAAQMGNELSSLFEMANGYGNNSGNAMGTGTPRADGYNAYGTMGTNGDMQDGFAAMFGNDHEFSRMIGELF